MHVLRLRRRGERSLAQSPGSLVEELQVGENQSDHAAPAGAVAASAGDDRKVALSERESRVSR